jgi:hypothetical protein
MSMREAGKSEIHRPPGTTTTCGRSLDSPGEHCHQAGWSGKRDSNPRPSAWKADALAAELFPLKPLFDNKMVEGGGFEPPKASPTDLQSVPFDRSGTPPQLRGQGITLDAQPWPRSDHDVPAPAGPCPSQPRGWTTAELAKGLEPPTTSLQMRCSTN